jgi:tetratricopeptide (TPR) repeat protein
VNTPFLSYRVAEPWVVGVDLEKPEAFLLGRRAAPWRYIGYREAERLLGDPAAAGKRSGEALARNPPDPLARLLAGAVRLRKGDRAGAKAILESLVQSQPQLAIAWRELGFALAGLGDRANAVDALTRAVDLNFGDKDSWYGLGDLLLFPESDETRAPELESQLAQARDHFYRGRPDKAQAVLRDLLAARPECAPACKLLADIVFCTGRWNDARPLLERALQLAPGFQAARFRLASLLYLHREFAAALPQIENLLEAEPANTLYRALQAMTLAADRQLEAALCAFERLVPDCPDRPGLWFQYALLLRALHDPKAPAAFLHIIDRFPSIFDAYVGLAGMTTSTLDESFLGRVDAQLARDDLAAEDRAKLHFVLGKTLEDRGRQAQAFEHYCASNAILYEGREYGAEAGTALKRRSMRVFTPAFFRSRAGSGHPAPDPIFVVGMPRSGSTLVEQILASHSAIEGLGELPCLRQIVEELDAAGERYPDALKTFGPDGFRALGEKYLALARGHRRSSKPFFTDKFPGNYSCAALIALILPNARIIDVRRHPLDCGFSCFKHYFPRTQPITLDLRDVGRAYVDYVELMAHFDAVVGGRVQRVFYEQLVQNPEQEIRRLLDFLGLPFEEECLRFHENRRLVLTLSVDQVRRPLYDSSIGHWRHYEEWLSPLREELGCVLDLYPNVPKFFPELHMSTRLSSWPGAAGYPGEHARV